VVHPRRRRAILQSRPFVRASDLRQNAPFISNFSSTNGRFLDSSTIQPAACAPGCFSTGFGHPTIGNETSNQMPNSWQFNLSVQKELWRDAVLEVGYVGNRNLHWEIRSDVNAVLPANRLAYFQNGGDSGARAALRPFGSLTQDNGITYYTRSGQSNYNSLQTAFNMRFTRNSLFQAAYTWSKLISDTQLIDSPTNNVDSTIRGQTADRTSSIGRISLPQT